MTSNVPKVFVKLNLAYYLKQEIGGRYVYRKTK